MVVLSGMSCCYDDIICTHLVGGKHTSSVLMQFKGYSIVETVCIIIIFVISGLVLKTEELLAAIKHPIPLLYGLVAILGITPMMGFATIHIPFNLESLRLVSPRSGSAWALQCLARVLMLTSSYMTEPALLMSPLTNHGASSKVFHDLLKNIAPVTAWHMHDRERDLPVYSYLTC